MIKKRSLFFYDQDGEIRAKQWDNSAKSECQRNVDHTELLSY